MSIGYLNNNFICSEYNQLIFIYLLNMSLADKALKEVDAYPTSAVQTKF